MQVVIRADASTQSGTGHVARCRTLADELRRRGANVVFVCRQLEGNLIDALRTAGHRVHALPLPPAPMPDLAANEYAGWLGVSEDVDAEETMALLDAGGVDWVVVDHYALSAAWHGLLRPLARRVMAIDDLANRTLDCDLLLDQNLMEIDGPTRYRAFVPTGYEGLFGPRFALLSPAYFIRRQAIAPRDGHVRRMLVTMGGSDAADATGFVVKAMSVPELRAIELDVVVGANYPHLEKLQAQLSTRGNGSIRRNLPSLADAIAEADIAVGAGGATTWERLCLGLPTVTISIAANQVPGCRALEKAGAGIYAGHFGEVTQEHLAETIQAATADRARLRALSARGLELVDGRGTARVADRMMVLA